MSTWYAASTRGFYRDDLHLVIPADTVEITDETHAALMAAQGAGKVIRPDADGRPIAVDRPAPDPAVMRRAEILARLGEIDLASLRPLRAIAAGAATDDDRARLAALDTEAGALRAELKTLTEEAAR